LRERHGGAVDKAARAAIAADNAAQQALAAVFKLVFFQPAQRGGRILQREAGAEIRAAGASKAVAISPCISSRARSAPPAPSCCTTS